MVFHRDIKSPNILLDRNGTAKMADFGLACLSQTAQYKVKQASWTVGYACPLYVQRGVVTEGSEIYSFGIVILELITASPPAYMADGSSKYQFLVSYIGGELRNMLGMADAKAQWPTQVVATLGELALRCTNLNEELRPGFAEVVNTLRPLRDMPDSQPDTIPPPVSKTRGHGQSGPGASTPPIIRGGGAVQQQTVAPPVSQAPAQQQHAYVYGNAGGMEVMGGQMILGQVPMPGQRQQCNGMPQPCCNVIHRHLTSLNNNNG